MAMHRHKYYFDRGLPIDGKQLEIWLNKAVEYFRLIDKDFLAEKIQPTPTIPYATDGVRSKDVSRKQLFIYPDYMDGWFSNTYHSDLYFNYLDKHNLLPEFYETTDDLELLTFWIAKANEVKPSLVMTEFFDNNYVLPDSVLLKITSFISNHSAGKEVDLNFLHIILANRFLAAGDSLKGLQHVALFNQEGIMRTAEKYEYVEKTFFLNQVKELSKNLALNGNTEMSLVLAEKFQGMHEKFFSYVYTATSLYEAGNPLSFVYLDSALSKMKNIDFGAIPFPWDARYNLIALLSKIGGEKINKIAFEVLRDVPEGPKFFGISRMSNSMAFEGNFYNALSVIPSTLTEEQDLIVCDIIFWVACFNQEKMSGKNEWTSMDRFIT
ncbi:MAG TPA: hypothetical protein VIY47_04420, partial [Ignavibacteriaceae bacterium]